MAAGSLAAGAALSSEEKRRSLREPSSHAQCAALFAKNMRSKCSICPKPTRRLLLYCRSTIRSRKPFKHCGACSVAVCNVPHAMFGGLRCWKWVPLSRLIVHPVDVSTLTVPSNRSLGYARLHKTVTRSVSKRRKVFDEQRSEIAEALYGINKKLVFSSSGVD